VLAFRRAAEAAGAVVREAAGVLDLERKGEQWHVSCSDGSVHSAPVLVNTAGAWGRKSLSVSAR
jgi:sarcosine oxidase, subunit beta